MFQRATRREPKRVWLDLGDLGVLVNDGAAHAKWHLDATYGPIGSVVNHDSEIVAWVPVEPADLLAPRDTAP